MAASNVVEAGSVKGLRNLSDSFNSHLRALNTIVDKEAIADGILIHLAITKMDSASEFKWEESLNSTNLPSWSDFAKYLDNRCKMLENLQHSAVNIAPNQQQIKKQSSQRFVHVSSPNASYTCPCCQQKAHAITNCSKFL